MSKKDYQALAAAIYQANRHECSDNTMREGWHAGVSAVAIRVADVLAADNPRFSRERFIEACETGRTRGMRQVS